jgi:hypothetical protein
MRLSVFDECEYSVEWLAEPASLNLLVGVLVFCAFIFSIDFTGWHWL